MPHDVPPGPSRTISQTPSLRHNVPSPSGGSVHSNVYYSVVPDGTTLYVSELERGNGDL